MCVFFFFAGFVDLVGWVAEERLAVVGGGGGRAMPRDSRDAASILERRVSMGVRRGVARGVAVAVGLGEEAMRPAVQKGSLEV